MEKESKQQRANLKIFHLTSFKMKRRKIESQQILSNQQINELINMHKPSKIKSLILKNHSLINYFLSNFPEESIDKIGLPDPPDLVNYHSSSIRHNLMKKKLSKNDFDKDKIDITEFKTIKMTLQAQLIFFSNIKNCHLKQLNELVEEANYQKEIMSLKEFDIFSCDIKSHFIHPSSKKKKIFNILNDKCSTSSKSEISQGNQKTKIIEEKTSNTKYKKILDLETENISNKIPNNFYQIENDPDLSELEDDIEKNMFKMFEQSDLVKFIPITFKDEYNSYI